MSQVYIFGRAHVASRRRQGCLLQELGALLNRVLDVGRERLQKAWLRGFVFLAECLHEDDWLEFTAAEDREFHTMGSCDPFSPLTRDRRLADSCSHNFTFRDSHSQQ